MFLHRSALRWIVAADATTPERLSEQIETSRISLLGNSRGGWLAAILALELAVLDESSLVKTVLQPKPLLRPTLFCVASRS